MDLTGIRNAQLSFNYFLDTGGIKESGDTAKVLVKRTGVGHPFEQLLSNFRFSGLADPTNGWQTATVDLTDLLEKADPDEFQFAFEFSANAANNTHEGWYIDDVVVRPLPTLDVVADLEFRREGSTRDGLGASVAGVGHVTVGSSNGLALLEANTSEDPMKLCIYIFNNLSSTLFDPDA